MLTGFFKSNKPIAGLSLVILPAMALPLWGWPSKINLWEGVLLSLCTGLLAGLVNLFLIYRSGYLKTTFLLGWSWWVVLLGLSTSGIGLNWPDLLASLLTALSVGFLFTLHQPVGQKDSVALHIGLLGAFASWFRPDAAVVLPLAWLGLGVYGHLNFRRVLLTLLPALGTWLLLFPLASFLPVVLRPQPFPELFGTLEQFQLIPWGWAWAGITLLPLLVQTIAALNKAKLVKRHALQLTLGAVLMLLIWSLLVPTVWVWLPGAIAVPFAVLTANALDYTQKGWIRSIWIWGYLFAALWSSWGSPEVLSELSGLRGEIAF